MAAFLPYQKFEIRSCLHPEAAQQKLAEVVEPRKLRWGWSRNHLPFEGKIKGNEFKISRIIHYNNNFLPILDGHIQDDLDASSLKITARFNLLSMILWPFFGPVFVAALMFIDELSFLWWTLLPLFFFFYGVPIFIFNWELNKAKKLLNEHFETDKFPLP